MAHQPYPLSPDGCRVANQPRMTVPPSSFTKDYIHRVSSTNTTTTSLCEGESKDKYNTESLDSMPYLRDLRLMKAETNTYEARGVVTRPVKSCEKENTRTIYGSGFVQDTKDKRKDPLKGTPQPTALVNTELEEDHTETHPINTEPTEYVGRGLLPSSSFIFLAEAPPPRTGRQTRLDYRAIFTMSKRENQLSRYGVCIPDMDEPQRRVVGVPDWSEFSGAEKNNGGRKKYREMRRTSGGRVRVWVE